MADLYRQEYAAMVRVAHLITGSDEVAEDIVQDSFVKMYRNWAGTGNDSGRQRHMSDGNQRQATRATPGSAPR